MDKWSDYIVLRVLGDGKYPVYKCQHKKTLEFFDVKVVPLNRVIPFDMPLLIERLEDIKRVSDNPAIVKIYKYFKDTFSVNKRPPSENFVIVSELMRTDLFTEFHALKAKDQKFSIDTLVFLFNTLIDTLKELHMNQVSAGNLGPKKLLVDSKGEVNH